MSINNKIIINYIVGLFLLWFGIIEPISVWTTYLYLGLVWFTIIGIHLTLVLPEEAVRIASKSYKGFSTEQLFANNVLHIIILGVLIYYNYLITSLFYISMLYFNMKLQDKVLNGK